MYVSSNVNGYTIYTHMYYHQGILDLVGPPILFDPNNAPSTTDTDNISMTASTFAYKLFNGSFILADALSSEELTALNNKLGLNLKVIKNPGLIQINTDPALGIIEGYNGSHFSDPDIDPIVIPFINYYSYRSKFTNTQTFYNPDPKTYGLIAGFANQHSQNPNIVISGGNQFPSGSTAVFALVKNKGYVLCPMLSPYFSQWSSYMVSLMSRLTINFSYQCTYILNVISPIKDISIPSYDVSIASKYHSFYLINGFDSVETKNIDHIITGIRPDSLCIVPYHFNNPYGRSNTEIFDFDHFISLLNLDKDLTKQVVSALGGRCYKLHPDYDVFNVNYDNNSFWCAITKSISFQRNYADITTIVQNNELALYLKQFIIGNPNFCTYWMNSWLSFKEPGKNEIPDKSNIFKYNESITFELN